MARPAHPHPTPGELQILQILWEHGPLTVRQVMNHLQEQPPRAYTSVMSLMNVMADKNLLSRTSQGRAFVYVPICTREKTLRKMAADLLKRVYEGSAATLVAHLLDQSQPTAEELDLIRQAIESYETLEQPGDGTNH